MSKIYIEREIASDAFDALSWMIRYLEWANNQTGLEQGPSPELQKAVETRDKLKSEIVK
jgi:hypothetical protein